MGALMSVNDRGTMNGVASVFVGKDGSYLLLLL